VAEGDPVEIKKLQQAYSKTFSSEEGQIVLEDLKKHCFVNAPTYVPMDPCGTHMNEGARSVLLHIQTRMKMDSFIKKREEIEHGQS